MIRIDKGRSCKPFLKWVGGKGQLVESLTTYMPDTSLAGTYHEPFLGGGALFFALQPEGAQLYDLNYELVNTYIQVRDRVEDVIEHLVRLQAKLDAGEHQTLYYQIREQFNTSKDLRDRRIAQDVEMAAWFIFLNRTGYNGLWRENKKGKYNVPAGRYKNPRCLYQGPLLAASLALQSASIHHADFTAVEHKALPGDFVYFDPPYIPRSATEDFTAFVGAGFDGRDQVRLMELAQRLATSGVRVMLSNSHTPMTEELYRDFIQLTVYARRNVNSKGHKRGKVPELVMLGGFGTLAETQTQEAS